jgi:hypothetical protein
VELVENRRYLWFVLTIVIGLIFGLLLGWNVFSRAPKALGLEVLRDDYKMDYVLMVAKFYEKEKDLAAATEMLADIEADDDQLSLLINETVEMLNSSDADEITKTVDIQSVLILQQALFPQGALPGSEVKV